jgi:uncharacterized membrane protein YdcZ (DUF606 family)
MSTITSAKWAFAAGVPIPMMATLNAGLALESGGGVLAAKLLFAAALICVTALAVIANAHIPAI